jgi:tetratricopeptide (TPR) repeat protein
MRSVWHYARGGRVVGPLTWDELAALAAAGQVRAGDPVWRVGEEPRAAREVPGLLPTRARQTASDETAPRDATRAWWKHPVVRYGVLILLAAGAASSQLVNRQAVNPPPASSPKELGQTSGLDRRLAPKPQSTPASAAKEHFDRGVGYARRGEFQLAVAAFDEAIRADPGGAEAFLERGFARRKLGDLRGAVIDYTQAIRLKPSWALAYANRAGTHAALGENERAVADASEAIRLDPTEVGGYANRALAYLNVGRDENAIRDCDEAIRLEPGCATAFNTRGLARHNRGEYELAIADFDAATRLDANYAHALFNRGLTRVAKKEYAAARADFAATRRLEPDHVMAHGLEAWVLACSPDAAVRDGKRAVELATRACELTGEKDYYALAALAAAHAECGQFEEAVRRAEQADRVATDDRQRQAIQKDLALYRAGKPYRDGD